MAIVIKSKKAPAAKVVDLGSTVVETIGEPGDVELVSDFADLIDRVGELRLAAAPIIAEMSKLAEKIKPLAEAEKQLQAKLDELELDPDATGQELGAKFVVEFGKKGSKREIIDMGLVKKLLGTELFMQLATVKLKDIDDYMTPPQKEKVLTTERTKRSFNVVERTA